MLMFELLETGRERLERYWKKGQWKSVVHKKLDLWRSQLECGKAVKYRLLSIGNEKGLRGVNGFWLGNG